MIDPNIKNEMLFQEQERLIAELGKEEFLRRLNLLNRKLFDLMQSDKDFLEFKAALVAMAFETMATRLVEKAIAVGTEAMKKAVN